MHEPAGRTRETNKTRFELRAIRVMGAGYWYLLVIGGIVSLARFSQAFLILRARTVGLPLYLAPVVIIVMNSVYAVSAYPAGKLSDKIARKYVLSLGLVFLLCADLLLGITRGVGVLTVGIIFVGLHLAFTEGLLAALVADTTPPEMRGTAYGLFNLVGGFAALAASVLAGVLWDRYGAPAPFFMSAGILLVALTGVLVFRIKRQHAQHV